MTKKISLIASAMLLSSTTLLADSATIKDAFKNGTTSGDIAVYSNAYDHDADTDSGYTAGSVGLNYETDTFNGVKVSLGFRAAHEFAEDEEDDYEGDFSEDSVMHTAAISYTNDDFFVSVGRQEIDLEWLGDYNESVVAGITAIPDTTIVLGYSDRQAVAAEDEISKFDEVTKDGAYVVDVKNTSIEGLELNPYYYNAPDEVDFYGLKASYSNDMFGLVAHYASSDVDSNATVLAGKEDGDILHLEASTEIAGVSLAAGYITTDKDGIGGMDSFGENIDPTDEIGTYEDDSDVYYASIGYSIAGFDLSAQYADSEYGAANTEANELYLTAGYAFTDELSLTLEYTDYEVDNDDSDVISATLVYTF